MAKLEGIYNEHAHLTPRAERILRRCRSTLQKLFAQARTPRECMDLERAFQGDVQVHASIRILAFIVKQARGAGGKKKPRRISR